MANEDHLGAKLVAVVNFTKDTTEEDTKKAYAAWAPTYEQELSTSGWVIFKYGAETFDLAMKKCFGEQRKTMKILDAGAGTGLVGESLRGRGYTRIDALDICQGMLDVAKEKNIYNKLICAALGEEPVNEIATGEYDGLVCCGTFSTGHAPPEGLKEIVRHVKSGGLITVSIRKDCIDDEEQGYATWINKLIEDKKLEMISRDITDSFLQAMQERYKKCYVFVFKVL